MRPAPLLAQDPAAATAPRQRLADLHTRIREKATGQVGQVGLVVRDPAVPVVTTRVAQDPADQADPVIMAPADPVIMAPADLVVPVTTDLVGPVGRVAPECTAPADLVVPVTTDLVGRVAPECTAPAGLVTTAALGTATTSAVTSTELRGVMDPHPGVPASRHIPIGAGRFPRPVEGGTTARSTTTATTKTRCGTPGSINGASTSSESGSRCKDSPCETPASPIGGAGVARRGRIP